MAGGRPTKYKPEFCDLLYKHMAEGLSFESFGGLPQVKTYKQALYQWLDRHEEFSNAKKMGELACQVFWEKLGRGGAAGKIPNFNMGAWCFNMKNRFRWKDRQEIDNNINMPEGITVKFIKANNGDNNS